MNGAEQRERFTAVSRMEKRVEDIELIVEQFATEIVADRERLDLQHQELITAVNLAIGAALQEERAYVDAFVHGRTFWRRLRWVIRGD
jgi:ribosome-binding protein aMBF1 (putative translation factor)